MDDLEAAALCADRAALTGQGAGIRRVVNGRLVTYEGVEYRAVLTSPSQRRDLAVGGFEVLPSFIARLDRAAYPDFAPALGRPFVVDGVSYRITEIADAAQAGEWRLTLGKA